MSNNLVSDDLVDTSGGASDGIMANHSGEPEVRIRPLYSAKSHLHVNRQKEGVSTRSGRRVHPTWKVRDMLPEPPGSASVEGPSSPSEAETVISPSSRIRLLVGQRIKTLANRFGVSRLFKRAPSRPASVPDYNPSEPRPTPETRRHRPLREIISPFPNFSSFLISHHHWTCGDKKSVADRQHLVAVITHPDFHSQDISATNFERIDAELAASKPNSSAWPCTGSGWVKDTITIGIPSGQKPTQESRRVDRHDPLPDTPAKDPIPGYIFPTPGFWHKSLCAEIKNVLSSDPCAARFVYDPSTLLHDTRDGPEEVYGELYHSHEFVMEDLRLQNSPREPGCDLPRAIVGLMFSSDATRTAQFGPKKMWPVYMHIGNQTKYERARPSCNAAHHVAYFPSVRL